MPWTLYRYILWDLIKLLTVSTTVLVLVISFAAAIKPLSDGLLGAASLLKFVGYTAPTMLAFVLPFAGAFASTIVFLRLASDNEITAMSASGISYASILAPVFALGLVLFLSLMYLSNFVIPSFYRAAAQTLETDLLSVLVTRLNQQEPFEFEEYVLYADQALERDLLPDEEAPLLGGERPSDVIQLAGVAMGRLDHAGRMRHEATATRADVLVYRGGEASSVMLLLDEALRTDPQGGIARVSRPFYGPFALPTPLRDRPEFLSWRQLRALRKEPERYAQIREAREELADAVAAEQLRLLIAGRLGQPGGAGQVEMIGMGGDWRYTISAPVVRRRDANLVLQASGDRPVSIEARLPGQPPRLFQAERATLYIERTPGADQPSVMAELERAQVFLGDERQPWTEQRSLRLQRMFWPGPVLDVNIDDLNALQMADFAASPAYEHSVPVRNATRALWVGVEKLAYRIKGQLHQRGASAVASLLVLLLGALLSMRHRHSMSLVVYFWSFTLAIVTVIIIHTGTNLAGSTKFPLYAGLAVLWSGNIALAVIAAVLYCQLARN